MNLEFAVLDSLADDYESLEQIENYLNFLGFEIQTDDVKEIIDRFLEQELIYIAENISDGELVWYGLSEKGKSCWNMQEPMWND